jgi:hypothetical protein
MARVSTRLVGAVLLGSLVGCTPPMVQQEVGTPTKRLEGATLVLLPRTCLVEKSVPARHFGARPLDPNEPRKTARLREALDALSDDEAPRAEGRPTDTCISPPDLGFEQNVLSDLRATDDTLRLMRERGAKHVVVLEVHTVIACARREGVNVVRQASGTTPRPWEDVCLEDEITISAYLFRDDGSAAWAVTREVGRSDEIGWVVDRVLESVPVAMPSRPGSTRVRVADSARASATSAM